MSPQKYIIHKYTSYDIAIGLPEMIDLYVFRSVNLTDIWAGVGARYWAVSLDLAANLSIRTRAKKLPIGGFGLFYCAEKKAVTTPFLIRSKPEQGKIIEHIWPEARALPFKIVPLGTPDKLISVLELKSLLPSARSGKKKWNYLLHVSPIIFFAPSRITEVDWAVLVTELIEV